MTIPPQHLRTWAKDIEKLHRIDGQTWEDIRAVLTWACADAFWRANILSGATFRKKWNTLAARRSHVVTSSFNNENQISRASRLLNGNQNAKQGEDYELTNHGSAYDPVFALPLLDKGTH
jgi:hypothetical protein